MIARTFNAMINEYLPEDMLANEVRKNDWFLSKVEIKKGWNGGSMAVGFEEAAASSIAFGSLTADTDIAEAVLVRGTIDGYKHLSASMIFNHRDLAEHGAGKKVNEQTFLKLLPGQVEKLVRHTRENLSRNLLNGKKLAKVDQDGAADGTIGVDRPERFKVGMKVELHDNAATASISAYVKSINLVTGVITLASARGAAGPVVSLIAWDVSNGAYLTHPGQDAEGFSGLKDLILPASAGGIATLYGKTKASYTYLQSYAVSGASSVTASEILKPIFDAYTNHRILFEGDAKQVVMSLKNFAIAMKQVEASKGAFSVIPNSEKATVFFSEVSIRGVGGGVLELVGVREMDDDVILGLDFSAFKFETNNFLQRIKDPEGKEYFTKRAATGYQYILDHECYGELVLTTPQKCWAIHSIAV